jgi:hypothetical protein
LEPQRPDAVGGGISPTPSPSRAWQDGLKVWFDEWVLKPGDSIPAKIEEGLEHSRVLALWMSANAFGSDWAQLEAGTFRFRDPLNQERRFIPLRPDARIHQCRIRRDRHHIVLHPQPALPLASLG